MAGPATISGAAATDVLPAEGLLVAVGVPKGVIVPAPGIILEPTAWVHAGGAQRPLSPDEYGVWTLALAPRRQADLLQLAAEIDIEGAETIVPAMLDAGLLMRVLPTDGANEMGDVRMIPVAIGAGNDPSRPEVWRVYDPAREMTLELDAVSFGIWGELDGANTLASACQTVIETFTAIEDKSIVWSRVPELVVLLMTARYAFLDGPVDDAAFE
jgi:hypothetical protein